MEAAKLGCIGSPLSLCPSRSSSRGTSGNRVLCALKSSPLPTTTSLSCNRPPSLSTLSPQLSLLSVVGTLANFVCLPVWASEEALDSSLAATSAASDSSQVSESVGASVGSAVQSSVERAGAAASKTIVADAGDGSLFINILGSAAFVALSLLSIGIVYLAVTDFLEKRKGDEEAKRLNDEAAAEKKKRPGSLTAASKVGAKGFGKKRQDDE